MTYRVTRGLGDPEELTDELAHLAYDVHPEHMRSGLREGAFILWWRDARGFRSIPLLFRPKAAT